MDRKPADAAGTLPANIDRQLESAGRELARLHQILADAIANLLHHFERIGVLNVQQRTAAMKRESLDALRSELATLTRSFDEHINGALTALQFQDLSAQLIQHVQDRLTATRDALAAHANAVAVEEVRSPVAQVGGPAHHHVGPVSQEKVSAGSIELF